MNISDIIFIILLTNFLLTNKKYLLGYQKDNQKDKQKGKSQNNSIQLKVYNDIKDKSTEFIVYAINYFFSLAKEANIIKPDLNQQLEPINKSSIIFELSKDNNRNDDIYKALLNHISTNINSKFLKYYSNSYYVINKEEFVISTKSSNNASSTNNDTSSSETSIHEIKCKVLDYKFGNSNELEKYRFEIFSHTLEIAELKEFIDTLTEDYEREKHYTLGRNQYYFNEIITQIPKNVDGGYRYEVAPKHLAFSMTKFSSNRSMRNIFGQHLRDLKNRVNKFLNNRSWYEEKGMPYTLGILLSGPPGTGKTSIIKAIANDSGRHIINVNLRDGTTKTQLYKLFYDEELVINPTGEQGKEERVNVPLDRRIYVIEDIDCMNDIVLDREILNFNPSSMVDGDNDSNNNYSNNIEPVETVVNTNNNELTTDIEEIKVENDVNIEPKFKDINGDIVENFLINNADIDKLRVKSQEISELKRAAIDEGLNNRMVDDVETADYDITADYCDGFATSGFTQIQEEESNNEPLDINVKLAELMANRDIEYDKCAKNVADGIIPNDIPSLGEVDGMFNRVVSNEEAKMKLESEVVEKTFSADFEKEYNDFILKEQQDNVAISIAYELDENGIYKHKIPIKDLPKSNIELNEFFDTIKNENDFPGCPKERKEHKLLNIISTDNNPADNNLVNNVNNEDISFKKFQYIMNRREQAEIKKQDEHPEKLSLSDILNIFDGVLETPGRIIIATSNHPYVLDPALVRPGRIDLHVETSYCDNEMIEEMLKFFYNEQVIIERDVFKNGVSNLTPAQVNNIIMNNTNGSAMDTVKKILELNKIKQN